jgi:hypothetical protein
LLSISILPLSSVLDSFSSPHSIEASITLVSLVQDPRGPALLRARAEQRDNGLH